MQYIFALSHVILIAEVKLRFNFVPKCSSAIAESRRALTKVYGGSCAALLLVEKIVALRFRYYSCPPLDKTLLKSINLHLDYCFLSIP